MPVSIPLTLVPGTTLAPTKVRPLLALSATLGLKLTPVLSDSGRTTAAGAAMAASEDLGAATASTPGWPLATTTPVPLTRRKMTRRTLATPTITGKFPALQDGSFLTILMHLPRGA